jgi:hypothetical protein
VNGFDWRRATQNCESVGILHRYNRTSRTPCLCSVNSLHMLRAVIWSASGGAAQTAVGILRACYVGWPLAARIARNVYGLLICNKLTANGASCWSCCTDVLRCTVNTTKFGTQHVLIVQSVYGKTFPEYIRCTRTHIVISYSKSEEVCVVHWSVNCSEICEQWNGDVRQVACRGPVTSDLQCCLVTGTVFCERLYSYVANVGCHCVKCSQLGNHVFEICAPLILFIVSNG